MKQSTQCISAAIALRLFDDLLVVWEWPIFSKDFPSNYAAHTKLHLPAKYHLSLLTVPADDGLCFAASAKKYCSCTTTVHLGTKFEPTRNFALYL